MKEIGEKLKEARESIGVTVKEAAEDLKTTEEQINSIEAGNMEAFKDIFYLKYFIRDYSKYLGLNKEDMVDEFNEYLFDYTSKISLDDIKNAKKKEKEEDRVRSPYTIIHKNPKKINLTVFISILVLLISVLSIVIYIVVNKNNKEDDNIIAATSIGGIYEFTK